MSSAVLDALVLPLPQTLPHIERDPVVEEDKRYEVIDGELREKPTMGARSNRVATILAYRLEGHADENKLGLVFTMECAYQIFPHKPKQMRKPDVSFMPFGRLLGELTDSNLLVPPDLAVEVVSTHDLALDLEDRLNDYLLAGVKLLWVIYPSIRSVYVIRQDGSGARLTEADQLSGEKVVPGFSCPVRKLFSRD